jgi:hypothetical protein
MSWISTLLLGVRRILNNGDFMPERPAIDFRGATSIVDNPAGNRTIITYDLGGIANATNLAVPSTICKRSNTGACNFGGTSTFDGVTVAGATGITTTALECDDEALFLNGLHCDGLATCAAGCTSTDFTLIADVQETRIQSGSARYVSTEWAHVSDGEYSNTVLNKTIEVPLDIPHGVRLEDVSVGYRGAAGHAVGFPEVGYNATYVDVRYYDTGGGDSILSGSDPSPDRTTYQADHVIDITGMDHIVNRTDRRYHVAITAESGTNAVVGAKLLYVTATWTRLAGSTIGQD